MRWKEYFIPDYFGPDFIFWFLDVLVFLGPSPALDTHFARKRRKKSLPRTRIPFAQLIPP